MNRHSYNLGMEKYSFNDLVLMEKLLSCMNDLTRLKLLTCLIDGEKCVCQLAKLCGISQSLTSHQLKVLKQYRLVKSCKRGQHRFYELDDEHVELILNLVHEHIKEK